jgi:MerR family mercuric resistance operon transcriptional regulator
MTRADLAGRTGCNLETIRYYEKIGLMPDPRGTADGYRRYDTGHERRLRFIRRGRELGFSIDDLKNLLDLVDRRAVSCTEVRSTAQNQLAATRRKIADLKRIERVLSETVNSCSGEDVPECPLIDRLLTGRRRDLS